MEQKTRILIAVVILLLMVGIMVGVDAFRGRNTTMPSEGGDVELLAGSIPIYVDGEFVAAFVPSDLEKLEGASFVDDEEGKTQEGWLLRDVLGLYLSADELAPGTAITVSSSSREKSVTLTWGEIAEPENFVMFDLSGRGTLKLVSKLEGFDTRDDWVQDVDQIEVAAQ